MKASKRIQKSDSVNWQLVVLSYVDGISQRTVWIRRKHQVPVAMTAEDFENTTSAYKA